MKSYAFIETLQKDQHNFFRSHTRLAEASNLPELVKFPIVLPSDSHVSKIIILDAHDSVAEWIVH